MSDFLTLDDIDVSGKTVLLRADLNVPVRDGKITDTTRLDRLIPTLNDLAARNAKIVIMSHFGRPKGQVVPDMSLKPVAAELARVTGKQVAFAADCIGTPAKDAIAALPPGGLLVLENLRYHAGEEANDEGFARELAALGDIYMNDAFSAAHRAHASTEALARLLPTAAGRLMEAELTALTGALEKPERPVIAIVGGAKISTKLELLGNLIQKVDQLVLGGGMANTFLFAKGVSVGKSLCESDMADTARDIMGKAEAAKCEIVLPLDAVTAATLGEGVDTLTCDAGDVPADQMILDIGPKAIADLKQRIDSARTVVWNGPLGVFETVPFDIGTNAVAAYVAEKSTSGALLSVAGGGDTVAALANAGAADNFSYVSTAGGAFLEWLEGKELPGVAALIKNKRAA